MNAIQLLLEGTSVATLREASHGRSILILVDPLPTSGLVIEVLVTEAALVLVVKIIALEVIIFVLEAILVVLLLEVILG